MTTTSLDLGAMALALSSAKKPCPNADPDYPMDDHGECECRGGEVYVLDDSVRVECLHPREYEEQNSGVAYTHYPCNSRGWVPLDPEKLGRWMVALAKAHYYIEIRLWSRDGASWRVMVSGDSQETEKRYCELDTDTPELALMQAAMKALGLGAEKE